jgi:hypothetical protein
MSRSDEAGVGCGGFIVGLIVGVILIGHLISRWEWRNYTVPMFHSYAEATKLDLPVRLDSEGRLWLWNEAQQISTRIDAEELDRIIKRRKS